MDIVEKLNTFLNETSINPLTGVAVRRLIDYNKSQSVLVKQLKKITGKNVVKGLLGSAFESNGQCFVQTKYELADGTTGEINLKIDKMTGKFI